MSDQGTLSKKPIGTILSVAIFIVWVFVDLYWFLPLRPVIEYPVFELLAYGSWVVIIIVIFMIISWARLIPERKTSTE
ncbi:MAG: hypothetical protein JSW61_09075 [Candidatus Thorarchaeota archaeon]|nr:MAG: hypothetical protein JSW61_09075 [Candidatus Thorarchaeota archaeon]